MRSSRWIVAWLVVVVLGSNKASASTEINGLFDAQSGAMGGTGVAFLDSAAAIPTNPALLDQINKLALTLDAFVIVSQPEAPYTIYHLDQNGQRYQQYESVRSEPVAAVLPFLGGAYRILDRVVIGAAIYPVIGQGTSAQYKPAPDELPNLAATNEASMGLVEAGIPVSVRLLPNLSLSAMWRVNYMIQSVSTPVPGGPPAGVLLDQNKNAINADIDVTGVDLTGFQLGVFYKPLRWLRLGFSYRSKVVVEGEGTTTTKNPIGGATIELKTQSGFTNPHAFRAGFAVTTLSDKLLLAADFKYLLYAEAYKEILTTTYRNGVATTTPRPAYWRNCLNVQLGAEYKLGEVWKLRAGYIMAQSATTEEYAQQFMAPPGVSHLVSAGFGIAALDSLSIDFGAAYVVLSSYIDTATEFNSGVGTYASHAGEFSLSATYRL